MLIQCTKKLLDELKIKPEACKEGDPLLNWHANLLIINRKKTVVLVNDHSRYVVVLHGLKAKEFKQLDLLIVQGIRETLEAEGIKPENVEKYLLASKELIFTKTKDRTSVARMNKACEAVYYFEDLLDSESIVNISLSKRISRLLVGAGKNQYIYPHEEMYNGLENFAQEKIFSMEAVQIKVTLDLEDMQVWRRLVVPLNREFEDLHEILQVAFNWKNYHLHEFYLYDETASDYDLSPNHSAYHVAGHRPTLNLVSHEEAFDYPHQFEMVFEKSIRLSKYLPQHKKLKYNYDFGDNWEHYIEVEKINDDYDSHFSVCLAGEGDSPPEDVGGRGGYKEFLEIISDPANSEYQHMVNWARTQGFEKFDIKKINRMLERR